MFKDILRWALYSFQAVKLGVVAFVLANALDEWLDVINAPAAIKLVIALALLAPLRLVAALSFFFGFVCFLVMFTRHRRNYFHVSTRTICTLFCFFCFVNFV